MYQCPPQDEQAYWLIFSQDKLVQLGDRPGLIHGSWLELQFVSAYQDEVLLVGQLGQHNCYLIDLGLEQPAHERAELVSLREAMMREGEQAFGIMARAWQLALFYRTHRFCGQCGSAMHKVDWELATHCNRCQHRCYPRISPCIIVAIRDGNKILLARGSRHKEGMYSTLAGFVESGESLEQAVHREVMEEVGVRVSNLRYFGSQPWPFPHSLMVGFLADYDSGDIQVDGEEIQDAQWFNFDALPLIPPPFSIAGRLIQASADNCK
ncbi:NAD(+) diphosphatase [Aliiglaciecola sp. CAU 1673]|uniref:NAD(+) diphosphatase n=1 Tax=Aliiglaciecola sp. CAU 1673 TaxID=3032595 RepID=UPI0023DC999B|nr:NAD(+) diphosphatase [Aliiglaciecola sp. CAU 1673]MDF2180394.1 NAD(+) diphosphatase [Aliiglaciecola sp. CAU 1673]